MNNEWYLSMYIKDLMAKGDFSTYRDIFWKHTYKLLKLHRNSIVGNNEVKTAQTCQNVFKFRFKRRVEM